MALDIINILKITLSLIACAFAIFASYIEIKKDPKALLNRYFAGFFILASIGFLFYTLYHIIFDIPTILILYVISNSCLNIGMACIFMVPMVIKYSSQDPKLKYFALLIFAISIGLILLYTIWPPSVDQASFDAGIIATEMNTMVNLTINLFRIVVLLFVLISFIRLLGKISGIQKSRILHFTIGLIFSMLTAFSPLLASAAGNAAEFVKMLGLGCVIIATGMTLRGFLLKE